jgi:hypothetical protein
VPFPAEAVQVLVVTQEGTDLTLICPSCIEYLGQRNPAHYPTIEEYEKLKRRYPEPIFDYEPPDDIWGVVYGWKASIDRETLTHQPVTDRASS